MSLLENRGRREDRVRAAPAVSRAIVHQEYAHEHTGSAEAFRPSLRNGFTAYFVLSPVTGFLATVICKLALANLAPAPGRQDHTTSPSAISSVRLPRHRVHRIPSPTSVTTAKRPSCGDGMVRGDKDDLPDMESGKYFRNGLDSPNQLEMIAINRRRLDR